MKIRQGLHYSLHLESLVQGPLQTGLAILQPKVCFQIQNPLRPPVVQGLSYRKQIGLFRQFVVQTVFLSLQSA